MTLEKSAGDALLINVFLLVAERGGCVSGQDQHVTDRKAGSQWRTH